MTTKEIINLEGCSALKFTFKLRKLIKNGMHVNLQFNSMQT